MNLVGLELWSVEGEACGMTLTLNAKESSGVTGVGCCNVPHTSVRVKK